MLEFFQGWRRKTGLISLLIASFFTVMWLRSITRYDVVCFRIDDKFFSIESIGGGIDFCVPMVPDASVVDWNYVRVDSNDFTVLNEKGEHCDYSPFHTLTETIWKFESAGTHIGACFYGKTLELHCMIPYWFIVLPLTLHSAYLILHNRPTKSKAACN